MDALILRNAKVLVDSQWRSGVDLELRGGVVEHLGTGVGGRAGEEMDATGLLVVPGFIDVHVHGADGAMCEDGKPESIARISKTLARFGVSGFLATLATLPAGALRRAVEAVDAAVGSEPGARILGIHLEGPYLSPLRAGAQAVPWMRLPSIDELDALVALCGGKIKLLTIAPELDGASPFIDAARRRGIAVSIGHSNATAAETLQAVDTGATHVTHLFNAMRELHHREPGVIGVALTDDRLSVELICDGHHVEPRMVDLALRCKPPGKVVFVSDAVAALGLADGEYEMFGVRCIVGGGAVRLRDGGNLAGSCLSLDRAVRNVHSWLPRVRLEQLLAAASTAPARAIGMSDTGHIAEGAVADLTLLDAHMEVVATIVRGTVVWRRN